ncbi:Nn.00g017900.m01.CDS01 [Neocucurbitaria sp. VM-36]
MEDTPLLLRESPVQTSAPVPQRHWILFLVALSIVAIDFGSALAYPPSIAIYESIICQKLHDLPCKSVRVQGELALLTGIKDTIDQIPGLLFAFPYGVTADRIGRRPILLLCLFGLLLEEVATRAICWWANALPLRVVWATPLAQALGGGPQIATSMAYAIVTDVFSPEERSSVFFLMAAVILVGEILASPISSLLMWKNSPWLPSLVGLGIQTIGLIATYALPETWVPSPPRHRQNHPEEVSVSDANLKAGWTRKVKRRILEHMPFSSSVIYILVAFIFASIGKQAVQLIIQYASVHFRWSIAKAALLIPLKGIVTLVTLLIMLPRLSNMLSLRMSAYEKDLCIAQGSAWMLAFGAALMAFASSPIVFGMGISVLACGWGFYSALRSLAIDWVEPNQVGIVSTVIAMVQSGGTMISGPLLSSAFRYGLSHSRIWRGLPYMVAAAFFLGSTCLVHCISRKRQTQTRTEGESSGIVDGESN